MSEIHEYKCPKCGGALEYHIGSDELKCPYCDSTFQINTIDEYNQMINNSSDNDLSWHQEPNSTWQTEEQEKLHEYVCKSCGGTIIVDDTTAASSCPYCGNQIVLLDQFRGELKPDYVIPFKFDKTEAMERLEKHLSDKPLLPAAFKTKSHLEEVKGVYIPFWMYDTEIDANASFSATRTRHWSDSNYDYSETRYYTCYRSGEMYFDDIPSKGSTKVDGNLMESIEPFNMSEAVDFKTAYLAGFLADKYDIDYKQAQQVVNQRIKNSASAILMNTVVGYDSVVKKHMHMTMKDENVKYCLLPVWLLSTQYNDKTYLFAMNGQTGKFVGNLPIDWSVLIGRFILTLVSSVSLIYLIVFVIYKFVI